MGFYPSSNLALFFVLLCYLMFNLLKLSVYALYSWLYMISNIVCYYVYLYCFVQNTKDNPPCNTLFIGNLGENINEEEVRGLFSV